LGRYAECLKQTIPTGTKNYGGSVVTAGGVLFIAETPIGYFLASPAVP
jgi:hypothetical protein